MLKPYKNIKSFGCSYALKIGEGNYSYPSISLYGILEVIRRVKNNYKNKFFIIGVTQAARLTRKIPNDISYPKYHAHGVGYYDIGGDRYTTFQEDKKLIYNDKDFPYEWWKNEYDLHFEKSIEEHLQEYLITIKKIQNELKGFNYRMFLMNNTFEGYFYESGLLRHRYSGNKKWKTMNLSNTLNLETLFPNEWNTIDLEKFVFYNTSKFKYGGLDEYCIDKFEKNDMIDYNWKDKLENPYGAHPNLNVQHSFYKELISNQI